MENYSLKKFGEIKVSEVMISDPLYFTTPDEKISTTELLMLRKKIGGLPVVDDPNNKKLIGIITQRDIRLARFAVSLESPSTKIKDLMTPKPIIVQPDDTIKDALVKFFKYNIERLPVVSDKDNQLIGLVIQNRILRKLYDYLKSAEL